MKRSIFFLTILQLFLVCVEGKAQDYSIDFEKINKVYTSGLSMDFSYSYYDFHSDLKPKEIIKGNLKQNGAMYFITLGDVEIINGKLFRVIADHKGQTLTFDSSEKQDMKSYYSKMPIKQFMSNYSKIEYFDKGTLATYRVHTTEGSTVYSDITVVKSSFVIQSITIFFRDNRDDFRKGALRNKLVVTYSNVKIGITIHESEFSIDKYVIKNKNKYARNWKYTQYDFVNMISK